MKKTNFVKNTRRKLWIWRVIDILVIFTPIAIYFTIALSMETVTTLGKVAAIASVVIALILAVFNVLAKKRLRCPLWIVLAGLFIAVKDLLLPLIIIEAIVTTLDDVALTPLIDYYKTKLISAKTIEEYNEEVEVNDGK